MKPIDKKDQPKLFALIGMAVLSFGFGIFQFTNSATAKPNPKAAATPEAQTASATVAAAEDDSTWKPDDLQVSLPTGGRDPFTPEGAGAPQPVATPAPAPTPAPARTSAAGGGITPPLPNPSKKSDWGGDKPLVITPPGAGPLKVKVVPLPTPTPKPLPPAPTLELSGVIVAEEDSRSKAIFQSKQGSRILGVGDSAGNGWHVSDIREGKVEIIDPKTGRRASVELK